MLIPTAMYVCVCVGVCGCVGVGGCGCVCHCVIFQSINDRQTNEFFFIHFSKVMDSSDIK